MRKSTTSLRRCWRCRWSSSPHGGRWRFARSDLYGTNPQAALGTTLQIRPAPHRRGRDLRVAGSRWCGRWRAHRRHRARMAARSRRTTHGPHHQALRVRRADRRETSITAPASPASSSAPTTASAPSGSFPTPISSSSRRSRADGEHNLAGAIPFVARQLTRGDVLLIEVADNFFARPTRTTAARYPRRVPSRRAAADPAGGRPRHHGDRAGRQRRRRSRCSFRFWLTRVRSRRRSRVRSSSAARRTPSHHRAATGRASRHSAAASTALPRNANPVARGVPHRYLSGVSAARPARRRSSPASPHRFRQ